MTQWPELELKEWEGTYATLHRWMQIVGKIRLAKTPWTNHSWHVTLYVTACGLTTSPIPYEGGVFEITFDLTAHRLVVQKGGGEIRSLPLRPQSVAAFHEELMGTLAAMGIYVTIDPRPNELEDATPFALDQHHAEYDALYAERVWRVMVSSDRVFKRFRSEFIGKASPVHFFWGSFDLAVTRFSGRLAPPHPGGVPNLPDWVAAEAYSHEVSSAGFWPGGGPHPFPLFYSYAYPEPDGFSGAAVGPEGAFYSTDLREFVLPYDVVRSAADPDDALLAFLRTTYAAAADLGGWDRAALERPGEPGPAAPVSRGGA